jgi:hypothetical protein
MNATIGIAKVADVVLLLVAASYGSRWKRTVVEYILQVHGFPI